MHTVLIGLMDLTTHTMSHDGPNIKIFVASLNQVGSHESSFVHQVKLVSVGWEKTQRDQETFERVKRSLHLLVWIK